MQNNKNSPTPAELIFDQFRNEYIIPSSFCWVEGNEMRFDITDRKQYHAPLLMEVKSVIVKLGLPLTSKIENRGVVYPEWKLIITYVDVPNEIVNRNSNLSPSKLLSL